MWIAVIIGSGLLVAAAPWAALGTDLRRGGARYFA